MAGIAEQHQKMSTYDEQEIADSLDILREKLNKYFSDEWPQWVKDYFDKLEANPEFTNGEHVEHYGLDTDDMDKFDCSFAEYMGVYDIQQDTDSFFDGMLVGIIVGDAMARRDHKSEVESLR
jgi:hypothetical protein